MHVAALHIGRQFPNSITFMIRGDSQVVSDLLDAIYEVGDRILLVGHSFGGGVVEELTKRGIQRDGRSRSTRWFTSIAFGLKGWCEQRKARR